MLFQVKRICLGYTTDIFSESALSKPGIYLVYTRVMPAHLKSCNPPCSKIAIGMPRHTGFGLQGCLMFIKARGAPTGHPSARAWTRAPGAAYPCRETQPSPSQPGPLSAATARAGTATAVATATARAGGGGGSREVDSAAVRVGRTCVAVDQIGVME